MFVTRPRPISFRLTVAELRQMYNHTKSDSTPILGSILKTYLGLLTLPKVMHSVPMPSTVDGV